VSATCTRRLFVAALLAGLALAAPSAAQRLRTADVPVDIEVRARTIDTFNVSEPDRRVFGALEFRGGLDLTSSYREFGGLSALRLREDGERFIAVTDKGRWVTGRLVYQGGRPVAVSEAQSAPMLAADGRPLSALGWYDTESLAEDRGMIYVGIERVNRIVRFDFARRGLLARAEPIAVPPGVAALPNNRGLEGLAFVPRGMPLAGTLIAISERGLDAAGDIRAFLIGGPSPGAFAVKRSLDYDVSDAALLPGGDVLLLERKFSWTSGLAVRIRRIALDAITPGAVVDGPVLLEADLGFEIDNMEGLSVHRMPSGEIVLTLVSDDNFAALQRTLLLQFTLAEP
jgi:hypothetical protein